MAGMQNRLVIFAVGFWIWFVEALRYDPAQVGYNLNENTSASDPLDYWGEWPSHDFHPSPSNWRMPMYTLFLDRFVNGDPNNDNANETVYEHDIMSNQLRFGGDIRGLQGSLDYLQGMGIKTLYLAGSPMINQPWASDGYSPLDLTLLDRHFGDIDAWREAIAEIHRRGMYVILDNTFATMGDLLGFEGYLNTSTPFTPREHDALWKTDRRYHDFSQSNSKLESCDYPRFWGDDGRPVTNLTGYFTGCRDSDFDQYGEVASFGDYTEYERQLSKFAFVQDRLREWKPSVLAKIQHFSCMTIASLDIDGMRIDKGIQVTLDAQGQWSKYIRECASQFGKDNFYIPGEIVTGNTFGSIYIGRGMEPEMSTTNMTAAVSVTNNSIGREYIRELGENALDAAAFHYSVYRAMTRFLGLDGTYAAEGDPPVNFVDSWNALIMTNDMVNAYTGEFDPRHMYGVSNQDVFRWPSITNGVEKNILGLFIVTLLYPGIPTLFTGEEQAYYVLENTASNYVFGRQPLASSVAWQLHGCYKVGSAKYANFPLDSALYGCEDDNVSLDHRDPSHPMYNIIKRMFELREIYPVLNDGYYLEQLANQTYDIYLPNSNKTATETGLWSIYRSQWYGVQDLSGTGQGSQSVWMLYTNENETKTYDFDCNDKDTIIAPFDAGTTVKNLFAPYEEYTLGIGPVTLGLEGSTKPNGCLSTLTMFPYGFKALVPKSSWVGSNPVVTEFLPGHDYRYEATASTNTIHITLGFSAEMDCNSVSSSITFDTTSTSSGSPSIDQSTVNCTNTNAGQTYVGQPVTAWTFEADVIDLTHGIHQLTLANVSGSNGNSTSNTHTFLLRVGTASNPMVFPRTSNFSSSLLYEKEGGDLYLSHQAPGADLWRYSLNYATSFSDWLPYTGGNSSINPQQWSGTKAQSWKGTHVKVQYWSKKSGSSDHFQSGDLNGASQQPRRFPNLFMMGEFNNYGYDQGLANELHQDAKTGLWKMNYMAEWPASFALNAWGLNPDGKPDATMVLGDVDGDNILDRIPPISLLDNVINITGAPQLPYLAYRLEVDDGSYRFNLVPVGSSSAQAALYFLLALVPVVSALVAVWIFVRSFYTIKFNEFGNAARKSIFKRQSTFQPIDENTSRTVEIGLFGIKTGISVAISKGTPMTADQTPASEGRSRAQSKARSMKSMKAGLTMKRRRVLIATMEYDIEDWGLKIKIGGLGVMAQLMGKNLEHQDLIWVVPCVGDIEYPAQSLSDETAEPMEVTILNELYTVKIRIHVLRNITYILLDAPIFRQQTKSEPYPPRMDDIESAVYYSAWNQCIAEAIRRFEPDLYHINDYHGALAPLHLLPDTIPCALSLHNAEFQGLWPMRTAAEREELCDVWNLEPAVVQEYIQFGEVFNLLHAGASYLRIHQKGFGAVGVSRKYGQRSYARYPIFWGLKGIGSLPNPDPTDTAKWDPEADAEQSLGVKINRKMESGRAKLRIDAQKWAGLKEDPNADLFVFVGRWSMQKGIDLIADIFPSILESHPNTQLICIGPVIDLYGKFAAIKLDRMMKAYPGRVYSKPEFTALPPYIFSGAEFALIPSRDEPFGLVAVEFGRKGALGVGARVGGLGQMPGWWYTVESTSTKHLLHQFRGAIDGALASDPKTRALLRARSAKQRFPVAEWIQGLETLQRGAIHKSSKYASKGSRSSRGRSMQARSNRSSRHQSVYNSGASTPGVASRPLSMSSSKRSTNEGIPLPPQDFDLVSLQRALQNVGNVNMGTNLGPGHQPEATSAKASEAPLPQQPESEEESDDDLYTQGHPILRALDYAPPKPQVSMDYDDDWDDYFSQNNPALRGDEDAPPMPSLKDAFSRSIGQPDSNSTKKPGWGSFATNLHTGRESTTTLTQLKPKTEPMPMPMATLSPPVERTITVPAPTRYYDSPSSTPRTPLSPMPPTSSLITEPNPFRDTALDEMKDTLIISEAISRPESIFSEARSQLSVGAVTGGKKDLMIQQKVVPTFTDPAQEYELAFEKKLENLSAKTTLDTCIEEFIEKSEKDWFNRLRGLRMGYKPPTGPSGTAREAAPRGHVAQSIAGGLLNLAQKIGNEKYSRHSTPAESLAGPTLAGSTTGSDLKASAMDQFAIEEGYLAPTGIKLLLLRKIGDWPVYSILLAFGQLIAANSYQITLLTGGVGEAASRLYTVASIYLVTSAMWWIIYRHVQAIYCLSVPFLFYALAFFCIGLAGVIPSYMAREWVQNLATAAYAVGSSSGSLFFALNFGDQGGAPVTSWVFRACVIQGTQQLYIAMLWWWGSSIAKTSAQGQTTSLVVESPGLAMGIGWSIAMILLLVGFALYRGLPEYYRQSPGAVPSFLPSVLRRKIVIWFFLMVILQNFFLSAPYGRNWLYLWSSAHVPGWGIAILTVAFLVVLWAAVMYGFNHFSKSHSWILPIFALGIGAPRWCQMLWGVSGVGSYVPWAGSPVGSAIAGRALWLWLGLLDSLQGVGFGMILLSTLTRLHISFTLVAAQVLGSIATMCARGFAPDNIGPGPVFPNLALDAGGLRNAWFWIALGCQLVIPALGFKFFRKEQLSKP